MRFPQICGILDRFNIVSFEVDTDCIITHWGAAIESLSGLPTKKVTGKALVSLLAKTDAALSAITNATNNQLNNSFVLHFTTEFSKDLCLCATATKQKHRESETILIAGIFLETSLDLPFDLTKGDYISTPSSISSTSNTEIESIFSLPNLNESWKEIQTTNSKTKNLETDSNVRIQLHLDTIANIAKVQVFSTDAEGIVTEWSTCAAQATGIPKEDVVGFKLAQASVVHEKQKIAEDLLASVRDGTKAHGTVSKMSLNLSAHIGERGSEPHIVGVIADSNSCDVRVFCESQSRLNSISALDSSESRSDFVSCVIEGVKDSLNGVVGMAELLKGTGLDSEQEEVASMLQVSCDHLRFLNNALLDLTSTESRSVQLECKEFELVKTVEDAMFPIGALFGQINVEMFCSFDAALPKFVCGDPNWCKQIVSGLLSKAIKFTKGSEIQLVVSLASSTESHLEIEIGVKEAGKGMQSEGNQALSSLPAQRKSICCHAGVTGLALPIWEDRASSNENNLRAENVAETGYFFTTKIELQISTREPKRTSARSSSGCDASEHPAGTVEEEEMKALSQHSVLLVAGNDAYRQNTEELLRLGGPTILVSKPTCQEAAKVLQGGRKFTFLLISISKVEDIVQFQVNMHLFKIHSLHCIVLYPIALSRQLSTFNESWVCVAKPLRNNALSTLFQDLLSIQSGESEGSEYASSISTLMSFGDFSSMSGRNVGSRKPEGSVASSSCSSLVEFSTAANLNSSSTPVNDAPFEPLPKLLHSKGGDPSPCKGKVLVAEECTVQQLYISNVLSEAGYHVDTAENGEEALVALKRESYDMCFMGVFWPSMKGMEAIQKLRVYEIEQNLDPLPIVAISIGNNKDKLRSFYSGANEFMSKPLRKSSLLHLAEKWSPTDEAKEQDSSQSKASKEPSPNSYDCISTNIDINLESVTISNNTGKENLDKSVRFPRCPLKSSVNQRKGELVSSEASSSESKGGWGISKDDVSLNLVTTLVLKDQQFEQLALETLLTKEGISVISVSPASNPVRAIFKNRDVIDLVFMVLSPPSYEFEQELLEYLEKLSNLPMDEKPILLGLIPDNVSDFWMNKYALAGFEIVSVEWLQPANISKFMQSFFKF